MYTKTLDQLKDEVAMEHGYSDFFQIEMTDDSADIKELRGLRVTLEATERYYKQGNILIPDPYLGDIDSRRCTAYNNEANKWQFNKLAVRDIFNAGINFYVSELSKLNIKPTEYCNGLWYCTLNKSKTICDQCGKPVKIVNTKEPDYKDLSDKYDKMLENMSPQELADAKKYFTDKTPKGWVNIEDYLPFWKVSDLEKGHSDYKVRYKDGREKIVGVADQLVWYYIAKEVGIIEWYNPEDDE